jgi:hypothetical protein
MNSQTQIKVELLRRGRGLIGFIVVMIDEQ